MTSGLFDKCHRPDSAYMPHQWDPPYFLTLDVTSIVFPSQPQCFVVTYNYAATKHKRWLHNMAANCYPLYLNSKFKAYPLLMKHTWSIFVSRQDKLHNIPLKLKNMHHLRVCSLTKVLTGRICCTPSSFNPYIWLPAERESICFEGLPLSLMSLPVCVGTYTHVHTYVDQTGAWWLSLGKLGWDGSEAWWVGGVWCWRATIHSFGCADDINPGGKVLTLDKSESWGRRAQWDEIA